MAVGLFSQAQHFKIEFIYVLVGYYHLNNEAIRLFLWGAFQIFKFARFEPIVGGDLILVPVLNSVLQDLSVAGSSQSNSMRMITTYLRLLLFITRDSDDLWNDMIKKCITTALSMKFLSKPQMLICLEVVNNTSYTFELSIDDESTCIQGKRFLLEIARSKSESHCMELVSKWLDHPEWPVRDLSLEFIRDLILVPTHLNLKVLALANDEEIFVKRCSTNTVILVRE